MLISYNWLKDFVKLPDSISPVEIADKLKLSTVEVEGIADLGAALENIVVGKILKVEKHPQADKLNICEVDAGAEKMKVVCGGSNVKEKMLVAFAKVGAKVKWHGEGEFVTLEKATIRGVESSGMICGADEIGLIDLFPKKEEKEIVDLSYLKSKPGTPLAAALNLSDHIFEIDNKSLSNRPDLWGHYGMAREVAVLTNRDVSPYKTNSIKDGNELDLNVGIQNNESCPLYTAVAVGDITVTDSPNWMKQRLTAAGIRPINSVVDITNYVMLELGQPMHAFDASKLSADPKKVSIIVRNAFEGEKFKTLDGKEHILGSEMLLIATKDKPVALAGIMGGEDSSINETTKIVVFESANFEASNIRKTSSKLGFRTDSSSRFEKGLDPTMCEMALRKAVALLKEISPEAKILSKVEKKGEPVVFKGPLIISSDYFEKKLGTKVPVKTVTTVLQRLGFETKKKGSDLELAIPSWRANDCTIPEDIVEEIARIYGYENIPSSLPVFPIVPPEANKERSLERELADILVKEFAFNEVYNYSFVSESQIKNIGDDINNYLELNNPLSKEKPFIRRNLLPNILDSIEKNSAKTEKIKIFEIGQVFVRELPGLRTTGKSDELLPRQDMHFMAAYYDKKNDRPFKNVIQTLEVIGLRLSVNLELRKKSDDLPWAHPARSAEIVSNGITTGEVYELHPKVAKKFGISGRVGILSLNVSQFSDKLDESNIHTYEPIPVYPEVERDLAFIIRKDIQHSDIVTGLKGAHKLLKKVDLFDVYEAGLDGKKSMAFHLTYANPEKTLVSEEIESAEKKIKEFLVEKWGVEFR